MPEPTSSRGKPSNIGLLWPIAAVAVAVVALVTGENAPLVSSRPGRSGGSTTPPPPFTAAVPGTHSHLWEDPLAAAGRIEPRELVDRDTVTHVLKSLYKNLENKNTFLVMPILTPGGPYALDREERMRNRYAVLSALGSMGYRLSFPRRMSAVTVPIIIDLGKQNKVVLRQLYIPIKLYGIDVENERQAGAKYVLLLWINEMQLGAKPLQTLGQILKMLFPTAERIIENAAHKSDHGAAAGQNQVDRQSDSGQARQTANTKKLGLRIVGPTNSDTLLAMLNENEQWDACAQEIVTELSPDNLVDLLAESGRYTSDEEKKLASWMLPPSATPPDVTKKPLATHLHTSRRIYQGFEKPTIYSPRATVHFPTLNLPNNADLEKTGLQLVRVVGSDFQVMQAVAQELRLRGAWPDSQRSRHHIVLVTERDTLYGRLLPRTFREVLPVTAEQNLHVFTYFASIDGKLQGTDDDKRESPPRKVDPGDETALERFELPEGTSQRDYLRRLAAEIVKLDVELRHHGMGQVSAIGVVGSDIFDKLLVLRALRNHFPGTCFFTTDLDARFSTSSEYPYTRNLIVVSHFGLSLNRSLRFDVPPFRDSYQTSTFLAMLNAVGCTRLEPLMPNHAMNDPWGLAHRRNPAQRELDANPLTPLNEERGFLEPLVFEIGRSGAFQLSTPRSPVSIRIQPPGDREMHWRMWSVKSTLALIALGLVVYCLAFYLSPVRRTLKRVRLFSKRLFRRSWWRGERQKAFRQRMTLAMFGVFATFLLLLFTIYDHSRDGGEPFALLDGISVWPSVWLRYLAILWAGVLVSSWTRTWRRSLTALKNDYGPAPAGQDTSKRRFEELLVRYEATTSSRKRIKRVLFQAFSFYALTWCIYLTTDSIPGSPYRGEWARWVTLIVTQIAYFSLIFTVFFVLDAVRQCHFLMHLLAREEVDLTGGAQGQNRNTRGNRGKTLNETFKVRFIASHTRIIGRMVVYPFLIALLLAATRLSFLDNWDLPLPLFIVVCAALAGLLVGGFLLRRDAQKARRAILARLNDSVFDALTDERKKSYVALAKAAMEDIQSERHGAFRPLSEDPVLAAVFIPFGGTGTLILLERLLNFM